MQYEEFLKSKKMRFCGTGKPCTPDMVHTMLFSFQKDIVAWAVRRGRCSIFADTGLGKTLMQLEWARIIGGKTLIVAPLSVARQTVREGVKIGIEIVYARKQADAGPGITITNYEMVSHFDAAAFDAVVLDESSILKAFDGKTRSRLIEAFQQTPYRLCCTATPAPNDFVELGNHAQFLGISSVEEMKATFFINANKEHTIVFGGHVFKKKGRNDGGQEWRLKHSAEDPFFEWLSTWAVTLTKPSDLGYDDDGFILPPLNVQTHTVKTSESVAGDLFFSGLHGIAGRAKVRKSTIGERLVLLKAAIESDSGQWIVWCGLDSEAKAATEAIPGAVEVRGSHSPEYKAEKMEAFQDGKFRVLITKPKICGFGMNFQNANNMAFFGLNDSWETWYQCIRREYRYGQKLPVNVHVIISDKEECIYQNVMRKHAAAQRLRQGLIDHVKVYEKEELNMEDHREENYHETEASGERWKIMYGDSCKRLAEIESESIDLSVYSPPFADLFTYTDSNRDLGNCRNWAEFFHHFDFIIKENLRVTKPGRLACVHTSDVPAMQSRDGYIGIKDFPGQVVQAYESAGWIFYGRALVQKNPQAQAIRVKSKALLFVQLRKDSSDSRPALIDQVLIFKKPGDTAVHVRPVANGEIDNETWIEWVPQYLPAS